MFLSFFFFKFCKVSVDVNITLRHKLLPSSRASSLSASCHRFVMLIPVGVTAGVQGLERKDTETQSVRIKTLHTGKRINDKVLIGHCEVLEYRDGVCHPMKEPVLDAV